MTAPRLLIVLMLAAHAALTAAAWRLAEQQPVGSPPQILLIALLRAQLSLLALYLALGAALWWARLAALAGGIAVWSYGFQGFARQPVAQLATFFTLLIVPVLLWGVVARLRGYGWQRPRDQPTAARLASRQFSLGAAFRWLTLAAIVLGLAKQADFPLDYWHIWISIALINTCLAGGLLWCFASNGLTALRVFGLILLIALLTVLLEDDPSQAWVAKFTLQTLLMAATLGIGEMAGWKLRREQDRAD